jgi:flagellar hook-length control protein FliK
MKIPEQSPNTAKVPGATSKEKVPASSQQKVFSDKMRKKKKTLESILFQTAQQNNSVMAQQLQKQNPGAVSTASDAGLPTPIQDLVHEIQLHIEPGGGAEVRIQFASKIFDGLRVDIRKVEDGTIAITFTTGNENTAQLLSKHLPALSSALTSKGVPVAAIQFETTSGFESNQPFNSSQGSDQRGSESAGKQRKQR